MRCRNKLYHIITIKILSIVTPHELNLLCFVSVQPYMSWKQQDCKDISWVFARVDWANSMSYRVIQERLCVSDHELLSIRF